MTARRLVMVGIVLGGFAGVAGAEGNVNWDGRYEPGSSGGTEKCPAASEAVVVSGGRFSFSWNVKLDRTYRIGTIAGSVRPSGLAVFKATVADPLPADARAALAEAGDTVEPQQPVASEMKIVFSANGGRGLQLD